MREKETEGKLKNIKSIFKICRNSCSEHIGKHVKNVFASIGHRNYGNLYAII